MHLTGSIDDLDKWMTQVNSGLIPADPFLLIGQMTTADPTRSPEHFLARATDRVGFADHSRRGRAICGSAWAPSTSC